MLCWGATIGLVCSISTLTSIDHVSLKIAVLNLWWKVRSISKSTSTSRENFPQVIQMHLHKTKTKSIHYYENSMKQKIIMKAMKKIKKKIKKQYGQTNKILTFLEYRSPVMAPKNWYHPCVYTTSAWVIGSSKVCSKGQVVKSIGTGTPSINFCFVIS